MIAADDVWAVGEDGGKLADAALERLDLEPGRQPVERRSPQCPAVDSDDVWAVGSTGGNTLTEHWNGTAWSVVPSPRCRSVARLYGVHAVGTDDVWAVGYSSTDGTLAIRWDGSAWAAVPSPDRAEPNFLRGVTALGSDDVVLVGEGDFATLVQRWDGTGSRSSRARTRGSARTSCTACTSARPTTSGQSAPSTTRR